MAKVRPKSWRYGNTVRWMGAKKGVLRADGKPNVEIATPPEFGGHEGIWSPEELFVAAVNSCIMTTFLYYQAKMDIRFVSYSSKAEGILEYSEQGLIFTRVKVEPQVLVASETDRGKAEEALRLSEKSCLISKSVSCAVTVEPKVEVAEK